MNYPQLPVILGTIESGGTAYAHSYDVSKAHSFDTGIEEYGLVYCWEVIAMVTVIKQYQQ